MDINKEFSLWLENVDDEALISQLKSLKNDSAALTDSFYRQLEFGTAGLRGELGPGTNRMNLYTVRRAALALGSVLGAGQCVVIARDTRRMSCEFAKETAVALSQYGVKVWMFEKPMPLPILSYAIRALGCGSGVMITASHNPPQYNGFKCYESDGAQISGAFADKISRAMSAAPWFTKGEGSFDALLADGKIEYIDSELIENYIAQALSCQVNEGGGRELKVLYTALNGTGTNAVPYALLRAGVKSLELVDVQMAPDMDFTTCPIPNPENESAFKLALSQAEKTKPDIILATDPDCDRIGMAVKAGDSYKLLSGNETGCLLLNYLLMARTENKTLPQNPVAIKSLVSLPLADLIAEKYSCQMINVPVGFKYIGSKMTKLETDGEASRFVFAFEESCGYLAGMHCRDKDAVCAAVLLCEMAGYYKAKGITVFDALESLYREFGYWVSQGVSIALKGEDGEKQREAIMARLRNNPPKVIAGFDISEYVDYLGDSNSDLPPVDILEYGFSKGKVIVRPSGTEPKLKIYVMATSDSSEETMAVINGIITRLNSFLGI